MLLPFRTALVCLACLRHFLEVAAFCLENVSDDDLETLTYKGVAYALPLCSGGWESPGPVAAIVSTLLREKLRFKTVSNSVSSSAEILKQTLGCTDVDGVSVNDPVLCKDTLNLQDPPINCWFGLEVWDISPDEQSLADNFEHFRYMGYTIFPGLYTQATVINKALTQGFHLRWWESYLESGAKTYFSRVTDVDSAIRQLTPLTLQGYICPLGPCGPGSIVPLCDMTIANSMRYIEQHMHPANLTCQDGWWYSPACLAGDDCIPVILAEPEWNMVAFCVSLMRMGLSVAVTWLGWFGEQEAVKQLTADSLRFLFYWWEPDVSFRNLQLEGGTPEKVIFDDLHMVIPQTEKPVSVMWAKLREVSRRVYEFLRLVTFTDDDVDWMIRQRINGASASDIACVWLRKHSKDTWRDWLPVNDTSVSEITVIAEHPDQRRWFVLAIVCGSILITLCLLALAWELLRLRRLVLLATPLNPELGIGRFVRKCMGAPIQVRLVDLGDIRSHRRLRRQWIVNGSPFEITLQFGQSLSITLAPQSYCLCRFPWGPMEVIVANAEVMEEWQRLPQQVSFQIDEADWRTISPEQEGTPSPVQYAHSVWRKLLPPTHAGRPMGHIKLIQQREHDLLLVWSPPHEVRGIPVPQFDEFMTRVIEDPKIWKDCKHTDGAGVTKTIDKPRDHLDRNMYDACQHLILPEAASVDASYAELFTDFGPAEVFISHVWEEKAHNTRSALRKWTVAHRACGASGVASGPLTVITFTRVWFCTLCNNQSRVKEELGSNIHQSPFARVLSSASCTSVALVSPFLALNRKWCNYEFCIAHSLEKYVWMICHEGVVQAGDVPPRALKDLALKVESFSCQDSICSMSSDAKMIDAAVQSLGGYGELDALLVGVFSEAIRQAQEHLSKAVAAVDAAVSRVAAMPAAAMTEPAAILAREDDEAAGFRSL